MHFWGYLVTAIVVLVSLISGEVPGNFSNVDIPTEHMPFYFYNFPEIARQCANDENCPYKVSLLCFFGNCYHYLLW